jgi:high affinity Mn2+ porin
MNRPTTCRILALNVAAVAWVLAASSEPDRALDAVPEGFYLGGHFGYAVGGAAPRLTLPGSETRSDRLSTFVGGLQAGYLHPIFQRLLVGGEVDVSFPNFRGDDDRAASVATAMGQVDERLDWQAGLRARVGYDFGRGLLYGIGGLAGARARIVLRPDSDSEETHSRFRLGWTVGAGVELPLSPAWAARLEYRYDHLGRISVAEAGGFSSTMDVHAVRLALDWRIAGLTEISDEARPLSWLPDWNIHGQTTLVGQGYPGFRSPYQGSQSLSGTSQFQHTLSMTAFLGVRPWRGAELYFNPELMQGFGLSDVHGVAAFPNGEAQKSNFPVPRINAARVYLSQSIGLGGDEEPVADGPNQLGGRRDVSRLTFTVGKLAVTDFFLVNRYAGEPRTGFLNWNIYGGGSYDWTMDLLSWTWGGLVELNQPSWAVRAGYFLLPDRSSSNYFDTRVPNHGQYVAEGEQHFLAFGQPGKIQLFGWLSYGNIGSYDDALAEPPETPGYPDVALTRGHDRWNGGFVVSVEQSLRDDLGLFSRLSYSPEHGESMGWTDCGESFSLGAVLQGAAWRRPQDAVGLAGVVEGLSPVAQRYFAAGGNGTIIGDGRLSYSPEVALETYYAFTPWASLAATFDYQLIVNPGYNADRGPVSIFAFRLHAAF